MNSTIKHKGYTGTIEVSVEDDCLHGRILFINDIVTYEGEDVPSIKAAFIDAVERYLTYCDQSGRPADKPCSGTFNVRIGPELHREAMVAAADRGVSLNDFVRTAITNELRDRRVMRHEHTHRIVLEQTGQETDSYTVTVGDPIQWGGVHATN